MILWRVMKVLAIAAGVAVLTLALAKYVGLGASGKPTMEPHSASAKPARPATRAKTLDDSDLQDRFGDGTPAFLRLDSPADQDAFRRWFVLIAEFQALRPKGDVPGEINDCAALLRYSYRNALAQHDEIWGRENRISPPSAVPSVEKYRYPYTPLGAALFRVRTGPFSEEDLKDGAFAEFADAKTLERLNTYFLSRDIRVARAGDLLFYRQLGEDPSFHSMVYIGRGEWAPEVGPESASGYVVYHTGPIGKEAGEMRRMRLADLLQHPSPRWRPVPGNSNFLGVYRWNILREKN